jgi:hypothetical protein
MSDDLWIIVPNWDKYQSYTDRAPPFIKLWLELQDSDTWWALNYTERGILVTIWMAYARFNGQLRASHLPRLCQSRARHEHLTSLNHAGLIEFSTEKPSRARASLRAPEEKRREREERGRPRTRASARPPAQEENPTEPEPERSPDHDQEALALIDALHAKMGWRQP